MKLWHKGLIAGVVSEAIAFLLWILGISSVAGEPHLSILGFIGGYLHYPGFPVEAWAHSHGYGDTMIPIIGVPLICWCLLWLGVLFSVAKLQRRGKPAK